MAQSSLEPVITWVPTHDEKGLLIIILEVTDDEMENLMEDNILEECLSERGDQLPDGLTALVLRNFTSEE